MLPDGANVDAAIVARLRGDATLMGLMPDGIYFDVAPGAQRFLLLAIIDGFDTPMFQSRAFENTTYLVKAVAPLSSGADVDRAAARIEALLQRAVLTVADYGRVEVEREARIRVTEPDEVDKSIRWQHRGGRYLVVAS